MIAHKHITKIIAVVMAAAVCLCLCAVVFSDQITAAVGDTGISMEYETALFDTDSIISVNILMDNDDWNDMLENATAEEYYQCDVEINGTTFYRVGIRPKGNTSLTSIASDPTTDRYSFKLEFDHYVDGQSCFGMDKLILNNNYADATNMKEALIYDMYQYLGADASLYNYAKISVNGEYWGVYLALEAVEDSFLLRNYGAESGELYKPDSMNMGGDFNAGNKVPGGMDSGNMTPPDRQETGDSSDTPQSPPQKPNADSESTEEAPADSGKRPEMNFDSAGDMGGFSMGGGGADLNYTDDDLDSYETIWDGEVTSTKKSDHKRVVTALKNISEGNDLEEYMDIDNLLRYMAVHVFSVNEDSLSGSMAHNYYLYESGGKLNLIPWDYNLAFGGMGGGNDATGVVNNAIDNAFSGTTFFDTLMADETYHSQYYAYLQQLVSEYIDGGGFDAFYERVRSQIDELVKTDPTAFYSYDEYLTAVDTLYQVVELRGESIQGQLDGTIPSTESAQRSSDALVDASALDISVMGSMNTGGGGGGFGFNAPTASENTSDTPDAAQGTSETQTVPDVSAEPENTPSSDFDPSQFGGGMPDGFDASQFGGEPPSGFDSSQFSGESQDASGNPQQTDENAQNGGNGNSGGRPSMGNFPGSTESTSSAASIRNLILYGVSLLVFAVAMLFAVLYRRRPKKR
ncbi:MAG: CotH kinase family protein [Oscillospiraceae bacterium]